MSVSTMNGTKSKIRKATFNVSGIGTERKFTPRNKKAQRVSAKARGLKVKMSKQPIDVEQMKSVLTIGSYRMFQVRKDGSLVRIRV